MRKTSGQLHVVDHSTEQIVAVLQPKDYRDDLRHWEIKNNIDRLEFKVFTSLPTAATLMQQNLILRETRDGRIIPYTIDEAIQTTDKRSIHVYASAVWVEIAQANYIRPQKIQSKTVNEFMDMALAGTKWKRGFTEYSGFHTMTIDTFIDPLKFLKDIASLFHLEIQYRVEVLGSQIVGWYVDMIQRRGKDEGKEITLGKDLIGIKRIENTRNICTALVGFVKGEGDSVITIESINKGLPYIVDTQAFQLWNKQGFHRFGLYTPETENQNMTPQRLKTLMEIEIKKRRNAAVTYEVEAQSINRVFGFDHESIFEGDTIRIKDKGFKPKLYLEARAIAGDESYKNPLQDRYMFGDYREIVDPNEELRKIYNRILSSLGNKQEMIDQLDKLVKEANETASNAKIESEAAKTLAEKVQENIKNNTVEIIESKYPPTTGLKDRKTLWLDISNGKPGILKLWKDGIWDPVVPDVESVKKETLEQVSKDIESTKTELNHKVQTMENKAQEIAGQIVDVQKQVNAKVDQTWINTQLKDKADKAGVYTKDEIKDGFIGKQVYETDKQGNVQKFRDINTSIGQTNEALTQKAEKSELKKTNEGLSLLENKTNEVIQTADGTKQTLTDLKTQIDNTKIGSVNILENSGDFDVLDPWAPYNTDSKVELATEGTQKILKVTGSAFLNRFYKLKPNTEYVFSAMIKLPIEHKVTTSNPVTIWTKIDTNNNTGTRTLLSHKIGDTIPANTWTRIDMLVKTADNNIEPNARVFLFSTDLNNAMQDSFISFFTLSEGNKPVNTWSPKPSELTSKTEFTQKTNEIIQTAEGTKQTLTELKSKVDSTKVGGENVLLNTMFNDMKNWTAVTGVSVDTNTKYKGYNTLKSDQKGNAAVVYRGAEQKNVPFNIGQPYTASFYVMTDDISAFDDLLRIEVICERDDNTRTATFRQDIDIAKLGNNNWGRYMATGVIPEGTTKVRVCCRVWKNGRVWIALPQFEEGNLETNWKPAITEQVTTADFERKTVEIETKVDGIKSTVSNVQSEQGKLTERMTKSEQTADGFKTSIESLTKKDTVISNKLNTVESTVEGTKKTISDVQQTTSELKKTTTEIKEEAGKISEQLTSVEKKFNDIDIGGPNLITGTENKSATGWKSWGSVGRVGVYAPMGLAGQSLYVETKSADGKTQLPIAKDTKVGLEATGHSFSVRAGREYTLSMEVATSEFGDVLDYIYIMYTVTGGNRKIGNIKVTDFPQTAPVYVGATRFYHKVKLTFKADRDDDKVHVLIGGAVKRELTGSNGYAWIRIVALKIEKGNVATAWTVAPEEQVSVDEFVKKTTEIEKSVDGVKTTVTNVQNNQAGFEKRVTTVEQTATGLSSKVSNLNNVVSDQGKKLTEANTKLEQQATAINAKVALKQVEDYVAGFKIPDLKQTVNQNKQDLLDELANKLATEQFNQKMTLIDNRFTINEQGINAAAKKTEVYTKLQADGQFAKDSYVRDLEGRIQITEKNILSTVKKGDIISSINQSAEKIKISAALIDLVGKVEASWLKAGLLIGMTIKTSNSTEHLHMENQVVRFVNQGSDKMVIGFENERKSKTRNPYIILGEGDGSGKNFGSIYKDGNGVYYRYVDLNGAESNVRLTNAGNIGITAQDGFWVNSKRANFNSTIEVPAIRFTSLGKTPGSQQGNFWIGNGYKGFGIYYYDNYWKFVQGS
ncbi:TPA: phage tail spike protein [Bacillus cereus]